MMDDWRKTFADEELMFYIVELADFLHESDVEGRQAWAELRQQQAQAAERDANATLIRNSDLGEWNDIHPLDKKTLGQRIAREALKRMKTKNQ
jgi:sialate O-acetylesterase